MTKILAFEWLKDSEVNQCTETYLEHFTIQRSSHPEMLELLFRKILENSQEYYFISWEIRVIFWEFSRIFQNGCFKEHIRTAASEIIWGNRRDGFLFHRCSRPEILE